MSSETKKNNWKCWNLPTVKMSHRSFIVIQNAHARNNELVKLIDFAYLNTEGRRVHKKNDTIHPWEKPFFLANFRTYVPS